MQMNPFNPYTVFVPDLPMQHMKISYPQQCVVNDMLQGKGLTELVEGPFGTYCTTYLSEAEGALLDHKWDIRQPLLLHPVVSQMNISLFYMLRGSVDCYHASTGKLRLAEGTAQLFYLPAQTTVDAVFQAGAYQCFQVVFSPQLLTAFRAESVPLAALLLMADRGTDEAGGLAAVPLNGIESSIFRKIRGCTYTGVRREKFIASQLYELLAGYLEDAAMLHQQEANLKSFIKAKMQPVLLYLQENLDKLHTVAKLAKMAGLTEATFRKYFKQYTGYAYRKYLKQMKMDAAKRMLLETNCTIKDIAYDLAFYDASELVNQFRAAFGVTPMEFRREHGGLRVELARKTQS